MTSDQPFPLDANESLANYRDLSSEYHIPTNETEESIGLLCQVFGEGFGVDPECKVLQE